MKYWMTGAVSLGAALMVAMPAFGAVTEQQAVQTAQGKVPGGSVYQYTKFDDGFYEVKFYHQAKLEEYEVKVDAATGSIMKFESDYYNRNLSRSAVTLTVAQAEDIVKKELPSAVITSSRLDHDDDGQEYKISFQMSGYYGEYSIRPDNGVALERDIYVSKQGGNHTNQPDQGSNTSTGSIDMDRISKIALEQVPGGYVSDIDYEMRAGRATYEVEVYKDGREYDIIIDAATGEVLYNQSRVDDWGWVSSGAATNVSTTQPANTGKDIGIEKAKQIALAKLPGGYIESIERDYEHGKLVYEVEVKKGGTEYSCDIDAATGAILKSEMDYDD